MLTCRRFDLVVVPFPFLERPAAKLRPALVLTASDFSTATGNAIMAMVTSARHSAWAGDLPLADWRGAGLTHPSTVRWKLFTLPVTLIRARLGALLDADRRGVQRQLGLLFGLDGGEVTA